MWAQVPVVVCGDACFLCSDPCCSLKKNKHAHLFFRLGSFKFRSSKLREVQSCKKNVTFWCCAKSRCVFWMFPTDFLFFLFVLLPHIYAFGPFGALLHAGDASPLGVRDLLGMPVKCVCCLRPDSIIFDVLLVSLCVPCMVFIPVYVVHREHPNLSSHCTTSASPSAPQGYR